MSNDNDPQIFTATYETLTNPIDYITAEVSINSHNFTCERQ